MNSRALFLVGLLFVLTSDGKIFGQALSQEIPGSFWVNVDCIWRTSTQLGPGRHRPDVSQIDATPYPARHF